tara:strand:+ start:6980 stop:7714 length:735 start_codon:yes stop_codon:yes gene_type:complete
MYLNKELTVVITTHVLPTAPSTHILEECINSIKNKFGGIDKCEFRVYCDSRPNDEVSDQYLENIRNNLPDVTLIENPNSGLKVNYFQTMNEVVTPYILFSEHDWIWLRDVKITELVEAMVGDSSINFVRFNKRNNWEIHKEAGAWETYIAEAPEIGGFPLMKTNCWATHPHVIRREKFVNDWMPVVDTIEDGWSIELSTYVTYTRAIQQEGFEKAQKEWGVFNYGGKEEPYIIKHLDGSNSGRT